MPKVRKSAEIPAKDRLLLSGALLFGQKGFEGVSVREICKHAKTSMNMIHHYFESKDGLLQSIVEQFSDQVFVVPLKLLQKPPKSKEDFHSRMEMLFEATLDAYIDQRDLLMVIIREQADPEALTEYVNKFAAFLDSAKKSGYVRKEIDSSMITGIMLDRILNQVQFAPWIKRKHGVDLLTDDAYRQRWCESNLEVFLNGMVEQ
jgi:AcrR family transcriptional regulator